MSRGGAGVPGVLRTHPSDETRIAAIRRYLPEMEKYKRRKN